VSITLILDAVSCVTGAGFELLQAIIKTDASIKTKAIGNNRYMSSYFYEMMLLVWVAYRSNIVI